jgi:hypothetical protein
MFDFQVSKHPHYDEACRAFAQRHNMAKLSERAGMNVQTLRNKLNPEQPHQFTPPELWLLTDLTEDSTLVDGFLAQIHCLPCVPVNEMAKEKLQSYVMRAMSELGELASGAVSTERLTPARKSTMIESVNAGKGQQVAQQVVDAFQDEFTRRVKNVFPVSRVIVKKGATTGVELMGFEKDSDRELLDSILQEVWEDESWR